MGLEILVGDTVIALNRRPPSAKLFAPDGQFRRSFPLTNPPLRMSRLQTGEWIGLAFGGETAPATTAAFREYWHVVRYSREVSVKDSLQRLAGGMYFGNRQRSVAVPFSPTAHFAARGDRIVTGSSDRYEVQVFDQNGRFEHWIRNSIPNPPVPSRTTPPRPADPARQSEGGASAALLEPPMPASAPAFDAIMIASDRSVWIRRYSAEQADSTDWHVYDDMGRLAATARFTRSFRPTEITASHVLGIRTEQSGAERIQLFRLVRSPGG